MTWENLTDSLIERSGLTGELRQGYVDARNYGAYGISHFQDMDEGYWIVACGPYEFLDCDVFVKISRYSPDEFMSISDKETLLKIINNRMMGTISETIISELPHDETDFSVAYGDKSGETHVLNVTIKNAELSQVEVEARVYEWLEKEFYTPEDFEYTWERATG
jgi:hypothetical protein